MEKAVILTKENATATVQLIDKESKNMFSKKIIAGINEAFSEIKSDKNIKSVIIHGYDTYFCCGGTQEELISILEGKMNFNDLDFFKILLELEIPVISAMSGHALGGGFVFGLYADFIVLAEESIYSTNFMNYGFTPGFGATFIVPYKLGPTISSEMLFTGSNFFGKDLLKSHVPVKVLPRSEVLNYAKQCAQSLNEKPRTSLVLLKEQLTREVKKQIEIHVAQEVSMHKISFALPEVRGKIDELFKRNTLKR